MDSTWYCRPNALKVGLARGDVLLGIWTSLAHPQVAEILGDCGADWLLLDMEHGVADPAAILAQLQALKGCRAEPVVRVPGHDQALVKRLLDAGVRSFLFPFVEAPEQAAALVAMTRYPPAGVRGVSAAPRASGYGRRIGYHASACDDVCIIVQIETQAAIAAAGAIGETEGVDAIFIGPSDLAASLGYLGNAAADDVIDAVDRIRRSATVCGKPVGIFSSADQARAHIEQGFSLVSVGSDIGLLRQGGDRIINALAQVGSK